MAHSHIVQKDKPHLLKLYIIFNQLNESCSMNNYLTGIDWAIILFYFAIIAAISYWAVKKKSKSSAEDYFLAGRHLGWFIIGASIFASNIGSEHLVGLAGSG